MNKLICLLYMYMYICEGVCMYICTCEHVLMYIWVWSDSACHTPVPIHTCISMFISICECVYAYVCVYIYVHSPRAV